MLFPLALWLAACNSATQNNEAIRQGVIDRLSQRGLNISGMEVTVTSVKFNGKEADAVAQITPKGGNPNAGMSMNYHLQQQGSKWVVVGTQDSGGSPHGGAAMPSPGSPANPHPGGALPGDAGGAGKMPSPEDLPPAGKK